MDPQFVCARLDKALQGVRGAKLRLSLSLFMAVLLIDVVGMK